MVGLAAGAVLAIAGVDLREKLFPPPPPPPWIEFADSVRAVPPTLRAGDMFEAEYSYRKRRHCPGGAVIRVEWWRVHDDGRMVAMARRIELEMPAAVAPITGDAWGTLPIRMATPEGIPPQRLAYWPALECHAEGQTVKPPPAVVEVVE